MKTRAAGALVVALIAGCTARHANPTPDARAVVCDPSPVCPEGVSMEGTPPPAVWATLMATAHGPDAAIDLADFNLRIAQIWNPALDPTEGRARVEALASSIRATLPARCDSRCRLDALRHYLFETMHLHAEIDPSGMYRDIARVLIPSVLNEGVGYCEGLAYVMVAVGDRIGLPLAIVPERQHVNVRYVDREGHAVDLDPTQNGAPARIESSGACRSPDGVYGVPMRRAEVAGMMIGALAGRAGGSRRTWLDEAVHLAPRLPQARNNRGVEREGRMDLDGALEDYRAAATLDPCVPFPLANTARVLARLGRDAEARESLGSLTALVESRGDAEAIVSAALAEAEIAIEHDDDAAADRAFLRALGAAPGTSATSMQIARARQAQGRYREAADAWRSAALASDDPSVRLAWIESMVEAGDVTGASVALAALQSERPSLPSSTLAHAMVAAAEGHAEEARRAARGCLARSGLGCARALLVLGAVARRAGERQCARQYDEAFAACHWPVASRRVRTLQREARARLAADH